MKKKKKKLYKLYGKHAIGFWTKVISYPAEDFYQARFLWFLGCQLHSCSMWWEHLSASFSHISMLWKMNVKTHLICLSWWIMDHHMKDGAFWYAVVNGNLCSQFLTTTEIRTMLMQGCLHNIHVWLTLFWCSLRYHNLCMSRDLL